MAIAVTTLTDLINSVGMLSDDECVSTFRAIVAANDAAEFDIGALFFLLGRSCSAHHSANGGAYVATLARVTIISCVLK